MAMKKICGFSIGLFWALSLMSLKANNAALLRNEEQPKFSQEESILIAIDCLDKACLLSQSIQDEVTSMVVSMQLRNCMKSLRKSFFEKNYEKVETVAISLHENLDEILEECSEDGIREDITAQIENMILAIQNKN